MHTADEIVEETALQETKKHLEAAVKSAGPIWQWGVGGGEYLVFLLVEAIKKDSKWKAPPKKPKPEKKIPAALRTAVFERDAYRCVFCGSWHDLTLDHVIPTAKGGADVEENLQTLCRRCNCGKGAK